jgi:hypothetical protein
MHSLSFVALRARNEYVSGSSSYELCVLGFLVFLCLQMNTNMVLNFQVTAANFPCSPAHSNLPNPNILLWKS